MLNELEPDSLIVTASGDAFRVSKALAEAFQPGDLVIPNSQQGLLHLASEEQQIVDTAVSQSLDAYTTMQQVTDDQVTDFFNTFCDALKSEKIWKSIQRINEKDVAMANARGRSTTRLEVSETMRTTVSYTHLTLPTIYSV